jgi:hypothetical protein
MNPMHAALIIGVLAILWSIYRLHRNPAIDFNMLDLLIENNRVSKVSCIVMGAFAVTTWGFILDCMHRNGLDVGILTAYGGLWVAPLLVRLMNPPAMTTTTTSSATATTTVVP